MHFHSIAGVCGSMLLLQLTHAGAAFAQSPAPPESASASSPAAVNSAPAPLPDPALSTPAPGTATTSTPVASEPAPPAAANTSSASASAQSPFALGASASEAPQPAPTGTDESNTKPKEFSLAFDDSRAAINAAGQFDPVEFRQREVPGDYVARPVTLPEGTFEITLNDYLAFVDASEVVGWVPTFGLGVTSSFEVGLSAPLRYNESLEDWTKLDPLVHLAQQWLDEPEVEAAGRIAVLIPATSKSATQLEAGVPVLWHVSSTLRVDAGVNAVFALEDETEAAINVPLAVTVQPAPWLYTGLSAAPNIGLTSKRSTGLDAGARLGLTLQARGSAQVDIVATFFAENVGSGRNGQTTDGIGTVLTAAFFPEAY